jgi:hypothetical protein
MSDTFRPLDWIVLSFARRNPNTGRSSIKTRIGAWLWFYLTLLCVRRSCYWWGIYLFEDLRKLKEKENRHIKHTDQKPRNVPGAAVANCIAEWLKAAPQPA